MLAENDKIQKTQVNQNTRFQQMQQKLSHSLVSKFTNMVGLKMLCLFMKYKILNVTLSIVILHLCDLFYLVFY